LRGRCYSALMYWVAGSSLTDKSGRMHTVMGLWFA
jgi:hypothetical protein